FAPTRSSRPWSTRFPYTTLFRSRVPIVVVGVEDRPEVRRRDDDGDPHDERQREDQRQRGPGAAKHPARESRRAPARSRRLTGAEDRKSTRLNSSHVKISYAVFCL